MAAPVVTDFSAYAPLREKARQNDPAAVKQAAHQFEALFTQMLLKSMRDATPGDDLMGSEQGDFYRDLFDQQMSLSLSQGKGLGIADMLERQLAPAAAPAPAQGAPAAPSDDRQRFIEQVLPHARKAAQALGVDPAAVVAQSALESDWGRSVPAGAHNLFGIKARAGEAAVTSQTREYDRGVAHAEKAAFKAYASVADGFADYARHLGADRYAAARNAGADVARFARGLAKGGYATDPAYAAKLGALASDPAFRARVARATQRLGLEV